MTTASENRLLVERLLGWTIDKQGTCFDASGERLGGERWYTFDSWDQAGLLLDAMAKRGLHPHLWSCDSGDWMCVVCGIGKHAFGPTAPEAIRRAALAVVGDGKA